MLDSDIRMLDSDIFGSLCDYPFGTKNDTRHTSLQP